MVLQVVQNLSSIAYPAFGQTNFHLRTNVINIFENALQFFGRQTTIQIFTSQVFLICKLSSIWAIEYLSISSDEIRLSLFPCTLKNQAKKWWDTFPHHITSCYSLCNKFFSPNGIVHLGDEFTIFSRFDSKCYYKAYERYKGLLQQCPQYGW